MAEHRVRLTDEDIDVIVASLRARTAGISGMRRERALWLALRLAEMAPGNPRLKLGGAGGRSLEREELAALADPVMVEGQEIWIPRP
jgi:hypothetical protein